MELSWLPQAGMESQALHREINLLEMQSTADNKYNASVAEVQQLFKEHSVHLMFQGFFIVILILHCSPICLSDL